MNGYIALKAITLNGIDYAAGEPIPADAVLPSRVPALLRTKTIQKMNSEVKSNAVGTETPEIRTKEVDGVELPIKTEDGVLGLSVSRKDIIKTVEILQMNADDAAAAIADIESEDALILINACDSRKTVKKAAKERAEAINAESEEDETATKGGDE